MMDSGVGTALAQVADTLTSSDYASKEVFIIIPDIILADGAATEKYLDDFATLSSISYENEPGTLKFAAFQPRSDGKGNRIFALEHFDSETSLAKHRTSEPFRAMLSWLQTAKPNGSHPLPVPIPLQIIDTSFGRPAVNHMQDPFVVLTQIECKSEDLARLEARIVEFGAEIKDMEEVLMFMPGKTAKEFWVLNVYRNRQDFEEKGLLRKRLTKEERQDTVQIWNEYFLELKDRSKNYG